MSKALFDEGLITGQQQGLTICVTPSIGKLGVKRGEHEEQYLNLEFERDNNFTTLLGVKD